MTIDHAKPEVDWKKWNHNELRELAEKASPGPWDARCREFSNTELPRNIWSEYGWVCKTEGISPVEDAEFISAANPETVLALLDEIDQLEAEVERGASIVKDYQKITHSLGEKLNVAIGLIGSFPFVHNFEQHKKHREQALAQIEGKAE